MTTDNIVSGTYTVIVQGTLPIYSKTEFTTFDIVIDCIVHDI